MPSPAGVVAHAWRGPLQLDGKALAAAPGSRKRLDPRGDSNRRVGICYGHPDAANKTSGFAQTIALCGGVGREHAESMLESTVSFPAIFFAAIIGVIVFIALSEPLLDLHE